MKRRDFVKKSVVAPLSLPLFLQLGCSSTQTRGPASEDADQPIADAEKLAASGTSTRVEASSPAAKRHLESFAKAVIAMKAQPKTIGSQPNGLNWENQAQIHKDFCPHGSWKFFPWHREYLLRFEAIVRKMSGDPGFSLPYWDWSINPNLPVAMRGTAFLPKDPLDRSRKVDVSAGVTRIASPIMCRNALATKDFETFMGGPDSSGQIEYGPHNGVHVVLGSTGSPMGDFLSPLDPVFWMHHCNVDRLWALWQAANPAWCNPATLAANNFKEWSMLKLQGFYGTDGKRLTTYRTAEEVIDTLDVNFTYDSVLQQMAQTAQTPKKRIPAQAAPTELKIRAFTKYPIPAKLEPGSDLPLGKGTITFPDFVGNNVGLYLDEYVRYLHEGRPSGAKKGEVVLENLVFRLKVSKLPRPAYNKAGSMLKISFVTPPINGHAQAPVFLTFYNFFTPQGVHQHEGTPSSFVPSFNLNYNALLEQLAAKGYENYPAATKISFEFVRPDGSAIPVTAEAVKSVEFKIVVAERIPGNDG